METALFSGMNPAVICLVPLIFLSCALRILPAFGLPTDPGLGLKVFGFFFFFKFFLGRPLDLENVFDKSQMFMFKSENT